MPETLEWAIVVTARVKDKGSITYPPKAINPDSDGHVAAALKTFAGRARIAFGTHDTKAVQLAVKFVERTTTS